MKKEEVLALIQDKKSAAGQVFDDIASAVGSIEIDGDVAALQAQVSDLQSELDALKAKEGSEEALLAQVQDKLSKDEDFIAKVKGLLDALGVSQG